MQRPDAESLRPVILTGLRSTEGTAPDAGLCPVKVDRTRPVEKICLGELTGNDRTLGYSVRSVLPLRPVRSSDRWDRDTWPSADDRTLRSSVRSTRPERPVGPSFAQ